MNKTAYMAALLFAATPVLLVSCSNSPEAKRTAMVEKLTDILGKTTVENSGEMLAKLNALENDAKEIAASLKNLGPEAASPGEQKDALRAISEFMQAADKLEASAAHSESVIKVLEKAADIFFILNGKE